MAKLCGYNWGRSIYDDDPDLDEQLKSDSFVPYCATTHSTLSYYSPPRDIIVLPSHNPNLQPEPERCSYCGRKNPTDRAVCDGCGAIL